MHDVDAFEERVSAYPAITVIRRRRTVDRRRGQRDQGRSTRRRRRRFTKWASVGLEVYERPRPSLPPSSRPGSTRTRRGLRATRPTSRCSLTSRPIPPLEDPTTGTRVGIGVATGADAVYLTDGPRPRRARATAPDAHDERHHRQVSPSGRAPTWSIRGMTVGSCQLDDYPQMARYLESWTRRSARPPRRTQEPRPLVPHDRPRRPRPSSSGTSSSSPTSRRSSTRCSTEARPTRTTASTSSPPTRGTSRCSAGCCCPTSPNCSSRRTASGCAAAAIASRRSTSDASVYRTA